MDPPTPVKKVPFKKAPVSIFIPKKKPATMLPGRPPGPSAAAAAKKTRQEQEPKPEPEPAATPVASDIPASTPVVEAADPKEPTMTHEQLVAANNDYYEKLADRDAKIEELEAELRAKTTAIEDATTNNANLQKEVKQYTKDLREKQEMLKSSQDNVTKMRTGQTTAFKALEKEYASTKACFDDAQALTDKLKEALTAEKEASAAMQETIDGANKDSDLLVQQLRAYQAKEIAFQEAKEFTDSIEREFELVFQEMGRDLNAATILTHIHELQSAASRPRRKNDRKISIADELANHSDAESISESIEGSEQGDDHPPTFSSRPTAQGIDVDKFDDPLAELTEDEIAEAEAQIDAEVLPTHPAPQSVSRRAEVAEIMAHDKPEDSPMSSPIPAFDFEKGFKDAMERCKEAEAALAIKIARIEELETAERIRDANANEAARIAAVNNTRTIQQHVDEKLRLTNEITRLKDLSSRLRDQIDDMPNLRAYNTALVEKAAERRSEQTAALQWKDDQHSRSMKAKDAQIAEWQQAINEAQSNSLLIGPLELNPVYRDVVREKTTLEWLRDAPFWWQFLLAIMFLFLCMGNLSAWMERHAWVTSNVFAMDHIRAMAKQGIRGPSAATLWFEDLIGFDRTYLG